MQKASLFAQKVALLAIVTIASSLPILSQAIPASSPETNPETSRNSSTDTIPHSTSDSDHAVPVQLESLPSASIPHLLSSEFRTPDSDTAAEPDDSSGVVRPVPMTKLPDFNREIYYRNRLEFSLETGWLPNNIPFVFDFVVGSPYTTWPLHYTLVPNIASLRWELDNPRGWKFLRSNTDFSFSGSYTAIPRGPETRYFAFDYGIRQNFVPRRSRIAPYVEARGGVGDINAKGPAGVYYAQGQDLTFTLMVGSGARYNINSKYSVSAGMTYMHVSNFYLSEPRYEDFGINVYGSIVGVYMRLGKPKSDIPR